MSYFTFRTGRHDGIFNHISAFACLTFFLYFILIQGRNQDLQGGLELIYKIASTKPLRRGVRGTLKGPWEMLNLHGTFMGYFRMSKLNIYVIFFWGGDVKGVVPTPPWIRPCSWFKLFLFLFLYYVGPIPRHRM